MNFILREETEQGMHNHVIGDEYTLVKRENEDAFRCGINSYLGKYGHSIENSPVNLDLIYVFITTNSGKVIPIFARNSNYYVMSHDGQTFEVIHVPDNLKQMDYHFIGEVFAESVQESIQDELCMVPTKNIGTIEPVIPLRDDLSMETLSFINGAIRKYGQDIKDDSYLRSLVGYLFELLNNKP